MMEADHTYRNSIISAVVLIPITVMLPSYRT